MIPPCRGFQIIITVFHYLGYLKPATLFRDTTKFRCLFCVCVCHREKCWMQSRGEILHWLDVDDDGSVQRHDGDDDASHQKWISFYFSAFMRCAVESASDKMFFQLESSSSLIEKIKHFLPFYPLARSPMTSRSFCPPVFPLSSRNSTTADVIQLSCTPEEGSVYPPFGLCVCIIIQACLFILIIYWTFRVKLHFPTLTPVV